MEQGRKHSTSILGALRTKQSVLYMCKMSFIHFSHLHQLIRLPSILPQDRLSRPFCHQKQEKKKKGIEEHLAVQKKKRLPKNDSDVV